jgi:glycosyltransferase involved in cell wall biosynthesis
MEKKISIIIPAKSEEESLSRLLPVLCGLYSQHEIIIINDGSEDNTQELCEKFPVKVIRHNYSIGNGASIKSGARKATGDIYVFMDADGQHAPEDIGKLLVLMDEGYDMVVGAREFQSHASMPRFAANVVYNWFASWVSGHKVKDLTSGFRAVRADKFREFIYMLPNGFSYSTTITMAMFRAGYKIIYVPIAVKERTGKSHIRPFVDGIRFLLIIFKIGTLYTPLKLFFPFSFFFFASGIGYYTYTYFTQGRFTNMGALLLITSILVFLIGLISEQLTLLLYLHSKNNNSNSENSQD